MEAIAGNRAVAHIAPVQCQTPADAAAAAAAVRERRKALFFAPQKPRPAPPVQRTKPVKLTNVPSLAEKFAASFSANPILKAQLVNGAIVAPDRVITPAYTIESFQRAMCLVSGCTKIDLLSQRRTRGVVEPRQIAMYLAKRFTSRSLPEIGRRFGGRDHTTVLSAVRKFEWMKDRLPEHGTPIAEIAEAAWSLYREFRPQA